MVDKGDRGGVKSDGYTESLVDVGRHAKTVKGGKIFSFKATTVVGDGKDRVGIGFGKAREVPEAIRKSLQDARKNMRSVVLNGTTSPR